jgi:hypothetical protein
MAMFRHTGLIFTMALAFMVISPCRGATKEEILRVNWNKQSLAELKRLIPDQKAAQQFAAEVRLKEPHTESDNIYKLDIESDVVDEYEFVDLKGDGSVQFVCLLDNGGRMRPTRLMIVENDHGLPKTEYLTGGEGGYGLGELRYILKDVKHDGKTEITTSDPLEPFAGGAEPTPYMEHIYVYKSGKLVQSDRDFLDYYKNESLPQRRQELNALLQHAPPADASPEEREYYRKSVDAKKEEITALSKIVSER